MDKLNIVKHFKENKVLLTDLGEFFYKKQLGEGGNALVLLFEKSGIDFAIKFLRAQDSGKVSRFKDEYFCASQIPSHPNIVRPFHFDSVSLADAEYLIIIMKYYSKTLSAVGPITENEESNRSDKSWKLFSDLIKAAKHLHDHGIIHRDIKPQNIFYNEESEKYALGDLGIAHFADGPFPKESHTKPSDRLANYSFSAPEQVNSKTPVTAASDIYSIGQVVQWYLAGSPIRGLGRQRFSNTSSPKHLKWLDAIVDITLRNDPADRFQSAQEIANFINEKLQVKPERDILLRLQELDDVIRSSFPKIKEIYQTKKHEEIERFINNFQAQCRPEEFWYMKMNGGDNTYEKMAPLGGNKWLFGNQVEMEVDQLIVYKDPHNDYKNFFILLLAPSKPFEIVDNKNNVLSRTVNSSYSEDEAVYYDGKYIDYNEVSNGYYDTGSGIIKATRDFFQFRTRHIKEFAYIIVPQGTATSIMTDREPTKRLLSSVVKNTSLTNDSLNSYLNATRGEHSREITKWN